MTLWDFYDLTPVEVDYIIKAYSTRVEEETKLSWEQVRTQIYYNYILTPSKKSKVTYDHFKKEYLRFPFDEIKQSDAPVLTENDINFIQDFFKRAKEHKP